MFYTIGEHKTTKTYMKHKKCEYMSVEKTIFLSKKNTTPGTTQTPFTT